MKHAHHDPSVNTFVARRRNGVSLRIQRFGKVECPKERGHLDEHDLVRKVEAYTYSVVLSL